MRHGTISELLTFYFHVHSSRHATALETMPAATKSSASRYSKIQRSVTGKSEGGAFGTPVRNRSGNRVKSSASARLITPVVNSGTRWRNGIINEVYYPLLDLPTTRDLQFLITDGETFFPFFHEEQRDLNHVIEYPAQDTLLARVITLIRTVVTVW